MADSPTSERQARPRRRFVSSVGRIAVILGVAGLAVRLSGVAESLAYLPSREPFATPSGTEDVWFESGDGARLHGWFMPAVGIERGEPAPAILHVHGNAGNISTHDSFSRFFTQHGFHVLVFDYRRYGRSDDRGPLRRRALLADTRAALAALKRRDDVDHSRIGVYGVSLGGVFALHAVADDPDVRAIATVSTFSTWAGLARDILPLLGPLLLRGGVEPADAAARLGDRPYLIVHGMQDEIINPRHAVLLAEAARAAGVETQVWTDPAGDHNSMIQRNPRATDRLVAFFSQHLAPGQTQPADEPDPG